MSTPDPDTSAPSADAERPPEAFPPFTERPLVAELWRRARQDYLGGDSAPVVAERYGLSERTVRRRASIEGWRKVDADPPPFCDPPPWGVRHPRDQMEIIDDHPEYEEIAAAKGQDAYNLLFSPDRDDLKGFAFRRACEAAAINRPLEAASWLRVQRLVEQCGPGPDPSRDAFSPDDHMRAAILRAMRAPEPSEDAEGQPSG